MAAFYTPCPVHDSFVRYYDTGTIATGSACTCQIMEPKPSPEPKPEPRRKDRPWYRTHERKTY